MARHAVRRWLYLIHRWIGIGSCVLFLTWFVSGLVMLYVPYPALTEREKLAGLPAIDWRAVHVDARQAEAIAGGTEQPRAMALEMIAATPVWRVTRGDGTTATISAGNATRITRVGRAQAARIAATFARTPVAAVEAIERDQWSVAGRYDADRPLWRVSLAGPGGRDLYVSSRTGAVLLDTDARERFWNWLGAVPHWIYPTVLRQHPDGWRQVVIWVSGPCILAAITGMWIGLLRVRPGRRRFKGGRVTPYHGWMLWHHVAGLTGGVMLTLWIFSGWLSVDPGQLFRTPGLSDTALARYARAPLPALRKLGAVAPQGTVRVEVVRAAGHMTLVMTSATERRVVHAHTIAPDHLVAHAATLVPGGALRSVMLLRAPDFYWYDVTGSPQLPVLRLRFDDPAGTWLHVDPNTGEILGSIDARDRVYRVVYDLLHRWDLNLLLQNRPARDVWIWLFSLAGIVTSISGIRVGWRRLTGHRRQRSHQM